MQRISTLTAEPDKFGAGKNGFTNGGGAVPATNFEDDWCDHVQEQLAQFIEGRGIALDPGNYDQLTDAIDDVVDGLLNGANTYTGNNVFSGDNTFSGTNTFTGTPVGAEFTGTSQLVMRTGTDFEVQSGATMSLNSGSATGLSGTINVSSSGQVNLNNGADIAMASGSSITSTGGDIFLNDANAVLQANQGVVKIEAAGTLEAASGATLDFSENLVLDNDAEIRYGSGGVAGSETRFTTVPLNSYFELGAWSYSRVTGMLSTTNIGASIVAIPLVLPDKAEITDYTALVHQSATADVQQTRVRLVKKTWNPLASADPTVTAPEEADYTGSGYTIVSPSAFSETVHNTVSGSALHHEYWLEILAPVSAAAVTTKIVGIRVVWEDLGPRSY